MSTPLVSIVVPTLNQAPFIEETIASIAGQNWPRVEIIVIDGGSTDGTREVVERWRARITHFVSEPDRGQADAINKGMRLAKGDVLAWLNSDDFYLPLALSRAVAALGDGIQPRLVYGSCLRLFQEENRAEIARAEPFDRERLTYRDLIDQPSAFWTRALWEKTGELTEEHRFVLDWEWWLRASAHGEFHVIDDVLSVYRFHGAHKTGSGSARRTTEICDLVRAHAEPAWGDIFDAVAARLPALSQTWRLCSNRRGLWTLHQLRHLDLYARYGRKVDAAFSQLHV